MSGTPTDTVRRVFNLTAAGHAANGVSVMYEQEREPGDSRPNFLLKPLDELELETYEILAKEYPSDPIHEFVPGFHGVEHGGDNEDQRFLRLDNLTHGYSQPRVMDVKLGLRTFFQSDCQNSKPRADLFKKMLSDFPETLTSEEIQAQAVTKNRYMTARDMKSTTGSLGYRLSGIAGCYAGPGASSGYRASVSESLEAACQAFRAFARQASETEVDRPPAEAHGCRSSSDKRSSGMSVASNFVNELCRLRSAMDSSSFVHNRECIGTSVLFIVDASGRSSVSWIDFAKTRCCTDPQGLLHRTPPVNGSQEDGLLTGLDHLIAAWELVARGFEVEEAEEAERELQNSNPCCRLFSRMLSGSLYPVSKAGNLLTGCPSSQLSS